MSYLGHDDVLLMSFPEFSCHGSSVNFSHLLAVSSCLPNRPLLNDSNVYFGGVNFSLLQCILSSVR